MIAAGRTILERGLRRGHLACSCRASPAATSRIHISFVCASMWLLGVWGLCVRGVGRRRVMGLSPWGLFSVAAVLWSWSASDSGCGAACLCCVAAVPAVSALQCYLPLRLCLCKTRQAPLHHQAQLAYVLNRRPRSLFPLKPSVRQHTSACALWLSRGWYVPCDRRRLVAHVPSDAQRAVMLGAVKGCAAVHPRLGCQSNYHPTSPPSMMSFTILPRCASLFCCSIDDSHGTQATRSQALV